MSDKTFYVTVIAGMILGAVAIAWGVGALSGYSCYAMWEGRNPSWGWFEGCQIDTNYGRIPAKNFRVIEE